MPTVLVVDDSQFLRLRIKKSLSNQGYKVIEASDGQEALNTYKRDSPDVVVMDVTMPNQDGLSALAAICNHDPKAQVIMLSALGQQSVMLEALKAGAKDFLIKPCDPDKVTQAVQKLLEKTV
jgi:two-component system chemotaxis response regulator CheY